MNDDHLFGPKVDRESNGSWASSMASGQQRDENGEPKRLSVELPVELQGVDRPRKRSSWFSEMCLGKESKFNDMELHSHTPSSSSISGPADGKLAGRGGSRAGGGVGSRLRASIFSVLGKLGMSVCLPRSSVGEPMYMRGRMGSSFSYTTHTSPQTVSYACLRSPPSTR